MGTNLRELQVLSGYKNIKTTEGSTQISSTNIKHILSPYDVLPNAKKSQHYQIPTKYYIFEKAEIFAFLPTSWRIGEMDFRE